MSQAAANLSATPPADALAAYHASPSHEAIRLLATDQARGLTAEDVMRRREQHGPNRLTEAPPVPLWKKFFAQFTEVVVIILIVAAVVSGVLGEWADCLAILAIVLLNAIIGFLQEERAEHALAALQKLSAPHAKVIREGALQTLEASELVPGDRIELEAGDNVPADARLLTAFGLRSQEAALTGESTPVDKEPAAVLAAATPIADRRNMVYMGTVMAAGKASAVVVATGMHSEIGRIAGLLQREKPEPTPLQRRLAGLGKTLATVCLLLVAVIFLLQFLRSGVEGLFDAFLIGVSLAVAAVPEGLPAIVTLALALGLQRMVRRNALVRRLPSVETLGSVTVICSDKTGTLTRNEMTVREFVTGDGKFTVGGAGYLPKGEFTGENGRPVDPQSVSALAVALRIGLVCNHAEVVPARKSGLGWSVIGDPTEGALVVAAMKAGLTPRGVADAVIHELPFDSERKAMSVVVQDERRLPVMYTKGAPEVVLARSTAELRGGVRVPLDERRRREILDQSAAMASRALRVLGLAYREFAAGDHSPYQEEELVFAGLVGMIDPPRDEAKEAVSRCHEAGVRPVMITGDHPGTAAAIACELGIAAPAQPPVSGQELDAMSDDELADRVEDVSVYARVTAEHKLRVVKAWKRRGHVLAMTGDGVNDAPAVRAANIGIAMGITGTDVTKEASAMVLMDDNFASIVNAVEEGRCIFDNIQKVLQYLLSCNAGEILLMLAASILGWPAPLLPIQLLWINLVTDGLPALALSMEPPEPGIMQRKPRPPTEPILTWGAGLRILLQGVLVGGAAFTAFAVIYLGGDGGTENVAQARTTAFCVLVFGELLRGFAARSRDRTLWQLGPFSNSYLLAALFVSGLLHLSIVTIPPAQPVFGVSEHPWWMWTVIVGLSLVPVTLIECAKVVWGLRSGTKGGARTLERHSGLS